MCGAEYSDLVAEMLLVPLFRMALVMVIPNGSTPLDMLLTQLHSSPISRPASLLAILMLLQLVIFEEVPCTVFTLSGAVWLYFV